MVFPFKGAPILTVPDSGSFLKKIRLAPPKRLAQPNYVSLTYSGLRLRLLVVVDRVARRWLRCDAAIGRVEFRYHHTNTEVPPNEQAGTRVSAQPSAARIIDSLSNKQGNFRMSNANQNANRNSAQQQDGKEQTDAANASISAFPGGFQAIATAYGDYTKKSFEDTKSFVEKLSGVKSFDKAVEIQTEFAKSAFETFVAESQKIGALYGDLAKQAYKPFGGFAAMMAPTNR
jgi:hypothetical protein